MTEADPRSRTRWLAIGVLLATFVAGGLVGVALDRVLLADGPAPAQLLARWWGGEPIPPVRIRAPGPALPERLSLTAEQQERIDRILEEDRAKAEAMLDEMRPRLQARYDSTTAAIAAVLTPGQRAELERLREERREQIGRALGRPGRPPGPRERPGPPDPP